MSARMRRASWTAIALAMLGVMLIAVLQSFARDAQAHAALIRSNPENGATLEFNRVPLRATLFFSEGLERDLTKIEVFDANTEEQVDEGDIEFDDNDPAFASVGLKDLGPGLYTVVFNNVSTVDGHPWNGVTQFIVLNAVRLPAQSSTPMRSQEARPRDFCRRTSTPPSSGSRCSPLPRSPAQRSSSSPSTSLPPHSWTRISAALP
jgi:methionine-rich copper-binding protein CopC